MAEDHRTRVGIERRQKMRRRLVESALVVFSEVGVDATVIDDVIATAGVSRGTFYNYFHTNAELLGAVGEVLGNELIELIEAVVGAFENPVERLGVGLRMFLHTAKRHPRFAGFIWRAGFNASSAGSLVYAYLPRHILEGMERGLLSASSPLVALHVLVGVTLAGTFGLAHPPVADDYPEEIVRHFLLALGAPGEEAERIVRLPLPPLVFPADSLLARTQGDSTSRGARAVDAKVD